jgi:hypothetical protein
MATLLGVYTLKGCIGRCDATCYAAKGMRCHCICGGRNHGKGRERVSTEMDEDRIELFRAEHPELDGEPIVVINRLVIPDAKEARLHAYSQLTQLDLFEEERVA